MTKWLVPKKPRRLFILVTLLALIVAGDWFYRRWRPEHEVRTEHYVIHSTATLEQTAEIGRVVEVLYAAYGKLFAGFPKVSQAHPRLKLKLFKDRREFRRCNRMIGWAEAFYREPYCHAYYSETELNRYHWMLHEAVHQLNHEVAGLRLARWLNEGLATYFSTSVMTEGQLTPGQIDPNTYPIWWLDEFAVSGDLAADVATTRFIPLRAIISGKGGPDLDAHFNLYYVQWWSLTHFLLHHEGGKYREPLLRVMEKGGTLESFEENIGPVERVQGEWHRYRQAQQESLRAIPLSQSKTAGTPSVVIRPNAPAAPGPPR